MQEAAAERSSRKRSSGRRASIETRSLALSSVARSLAPLSAARSFASLPATWLALFASAFASCGGCSTSPDRGAAHVEKDSGSPIVWSYEVAVGAGGRELEIQAEYAPRSAKSLSLQNGAEPFVHDVEIAAGESWRKLEAQDNFWTLPDDGEAHKLRYRFLLHDAGHALRDPDTASYSGDVFVAPPSSWLLHPFDSRSGDAFRIHFTVPSGTQYACGVLPDPSRAENTFAGAAEDLSMTPYCAFGAVGIQRVQAAGGAEIEVAIAPGNYGVSEQEIVRWVERSSRAVGDYFGMFPMRSSCVIITEGRGRSVEGGKTMGNSGASILIGIGRRAGQRALDEDWILTHEMIHLALPSVPRQHHWLEEGSATYIEPIARARAGQRTPEPVWRELVQGLPQGLPEANDHGLDHTPTWGRTYWGGALYWLLCDIEIRKRTENRKGLEDALRGIIDAGGTIAANWEIERVLATGDKAVGVPVLSETYAKMANDPYPVDLPALWKELGISLSGRTVTFDDSAPLAAIRKAITRTKQ